MKRYFLFIGADYYPLKGMGDFQGDFDTLEEAIRYSEQYVEEWEYVWASVFDTETRKEVWSK